MAPKITYINDIEPAKMEWTVRVRVIRLWKARNFKNPMIINSIEMLLLDEKCTKIQASIKQNLIPRFETVVQEGRCYVIQNFLVAQNVPTYKTTNHKFKLNVMGTTKFMPTEAPNIPLNFFNFLSFSQVLSGVDNTDYVDIIGHIVQKHDFKETAKNGNKNTLIDIVLEDLEGNRIDCTLWEKYAEEMHQYLTNHNTDTSVIVILQLCKLKTFNGKMGISNAFNGTKLLINPNIKEDCEYRERLESSNNNLTQVVSYVSSQTGVSLADDLLQSQRKTISEIVQAVESSLSVVLAKVYDIATDQGWYYESCTKCMRKVLIIGKQYYCEKCLTTVTAIPRYKLNLKVIDLTGSATFVIFDRFVSQYVGKSATDLMKSVAKGDHVVEFPSVFDFFKEKEFLFKVEVSESNVDHGWQSYTVKKMTDEVSIIENFKKQYGIKDDEESELKNIVSAEVDDNMKVCPNDGDSVLNADFSQPDHDSAENGIDHTPSSKVMGKRIAEEVDLCSQHDYCGTQNSTSKMPKFVHIKEEPSD